MTSLQMNRENELGEAARQHPAARSAATFSVPINNQSAHLSIARIFLNIPVRARARERVGWFGGVELRSRTQIEGRERQPVSEAFEARLTQLKREIRTFYSTRGGLNERCFE